MHPGEKLIYLHSFKFDVQKAIDSVPEHNEWVAQYLPCKITEMAIKMI